MDASITDFTRKIDETLNERKKRDEITREELRYNVGTLNDLAQTRDRVAETNV